MSQADRQKLYHLLQRNGFTVAAHHVDDICQEQTASWLVTIWQRWEKMREQVPRRNTTAHSNTTH